MALGQRAVEMHIAAIHNQMLACCVPGLRWRQQKDYGSRNLFCIRHAVFQWNIFSDPAQRSLRIWLPGKPAFVEWRYHLSW